MEFVAKTLFGLEEVLAKELSGLGAKNVQVLKRAVSFEGDMAVMY
jgi:putative N6-adenine-specific DNA methylase